MRPVSHPIDRVEVTFDEPKMVGQAGLLLVGTLVARLGLEAVIDRLVHLGARVGGANPGRKVLTLVHALVAGANHIDHVDILRAGDTAAVLPHQVMALHRGQLPAGVQLRPCPPARIRSCVFR